MRMTIEIDENELGEIQHETGISGKSPAVRKALELYLRDMKKRKLIQRVMEGRTDYGRTNEEVEALVTYDTH
ncbi:MAG: type II toxin-antitoxin system VapB family antitoxin [bacterium]|jgi:Arc/MetJ family transcription regulator